MGIRKITLGHLDISRSAKVYVNTALNNNRLSRGPFTQLVEKTFAHLHDSRYGIFLNSGTSALQVALTALKEVYGYKDGEEVLVPATTFIATSNIVLQCGMKPVFVEVNPITFNMDPDEIVRKITHKTRCIIPVHLFGLPADMARIRNIANRYVLQIIEDSCETVLSKTSERPVGSWGELACFSTYVAHHVVGGIGGFITTSSTKLDEICRSLMQHGRDSIYTNIDQDDTQDEKLMKQMIERRYSFQRVGFSYRATELEAALALAALDDIRKSVRIRQSNANYLTRLLEDLKHVLLLPYTPEHQEHTYMMYPMVCKEGVDREALLMHLEKNGIETRYLFPLLSQPVYVKLFPGLAEQYPVSQNLGKQGFFIGMHQGLIVKDMFYISKVIHGYFK